MSGYKSFVCKETYNGAYFTVRSFDNITKSAGWSEYQSQYLSNLLRDLVENEGEVFQFDTYQELLEWALED